MPEYVMTYLGGNKPAIAEEGQVRFAKYREWLVSPAKTAIRPANPLSKMHAVKPDATVKAGGSTGMSGHTTV